MSGNADVLAGMAGKSSPGGYEVEGTASGSGSGVLSAGDTQPHSHPPHPAQQAQALTAGNDVPQEVAGSVWDHANHKPNKMRMNRCTARR